MKYLRSFYSYFLIYTVFIVWQWNWVIKTLHPQHKNYWQIFSQTLGQWKSSGSFSVMYSGFLGMQLGILFLLLGVGWFLARKQKKKTIMIFVSFISILYYADVVYFRYFHDFVNVSLLSQIGQLQSLGGSILQLIAKRDLVYFFFVFSFLVWTYIYFTYYNHFDFSIKKWHHLFIFVGILICTLDFYSYKNRYGLMVLEDRWSNEAVYTKLGLIPFHVYDITSYAKNAIVRSKPLPKEELISLQGYMEKKKVFVADTETYEKANVIVLQTEALHSFVIGKSVNGKEITPNLNELIKSSDYYKNIYHQTGTGRTADAEFLLHSSLYPVKTGAAFMNYSQNTYESIGNILSKTGYETAVFHPYQKSFWNRNVMYKQLGMETYYSQEFYKPGEVVGWTIGDEGFFQQSVDLMKKQKQPFFNVMISLSSHHPYKMPPKYQTFTLPNTDPLIQNYINSVHYVDMAVGKLIQKLKDENLWDNTVFVLYGDHDASFKDYKAVQNLFKLPIDNMHVTQTKNGIPLVIHKPGQKRGETFSQTGGQIQFAPTILQYVGEKPSFYMMGKPLQTKENALVSFHNGEFTNGDVWYIPDASRMFSKGTCYDFKTGGKTDIHACKKPYDQSVKERDVSQKVMDKDMIKTQPKK